MDAFTSAELDRLRSQPQKFTPKLTAFRPHTIWQGVVNGDQDKGTREVLVSGTFGSQEDIPEGVTLLIGVAGVNQKRLRIRNGVYGYPTSGTIQVAENSEDWVNGTYLEAILYWEPTAIFPRISNDSFNNIVYYEDYDVTYSYENGQGTMDPVVNIGPSAFVLELDAESSGTYVDLTIDATENSFIFDDDYVTRVNHNWSVYTGDNDPWDAEIIGSSSGTIVTYRFWQPGDYIIRCDAFNNLEPYITTYAIRPVMVRHNKPGHAYSPFYDFTASNLSGSRDTGYWTASVEIMEDCDETTLPRYVPIVIYGDAVYGSGANRSTEQVAWHYANTKHQKFTGWALEESWVGDYKVKGKPVRFEAMGICGVLDQLTGYSLWLQKVNAPLDWTQMYDIDVDRTIYFYLRNRTNILHLTDWHKTGINRLTRYAEIPQGDIYPSLREFLTGTIYADMVSDRNSAIWTELDAQVVQDSVRATLAVDVHTITPDDHLDEITIPVSRDRPEVSWLSIDGLYIDANGNDVPLISYAPGYVISYKGGAPETRSGLIVPSTQAELDVLAGRVYAMKNNPYKSIGYKTIGNYPYDIAPQASIKYTLSSGTFREVSLTGADLLIRDVNDEFNNANHALISTLKLECALVDSDSDANPNIPRAVAGVEGVFPPENIIAVDPDQFKIDWDSPAFDWPDFSLPSSLPSSTSSGDPFTSSPAMFACSPIAIGRDLDPSSTSAPVWQKLINIDDGDLEGTSAERIERFELDPWHPLERAYICTTDFNAGTFYARVYEITNLSGVPGAQGVTKTFELTNTWSYFTMDIAPSINYEGYVSLELAWQTGLFNETFQWYRQTTYGTGFSYVDCIKTPSACFDDLNVFGPELISHGLGYFSGDGKVSIMTYHARVAGSLDGFALINTNSGSGSPTYFSEADQMQTASHTGIVFIPYAGNENMDKFYFASKFGPSGGSVTEQTMGFFDRGSITYISPPDTSNPGKYWGCGVNGGGAIAASYRWGIHCNTLDINEVSLIDGIQLHISSDGGANWDTPILLPNAPATTYSYYYVSGWPTDTNIYFIASCEQYKAYWTNDKGSTWYDLMGNWGSVVDPSLSFARGLIRIIPVYLPSNT